MRGALRILGWVLLVGGVTAAALATRLAVTDEAYYRTLRAFERHSDHLLFQLEYQAALIRHVAYIVTAVLSALIGVVGSAALFALAAILGRLEACRDRKPSGAHGTERLSGQPG